MIRNLNDFEQDLANLYFNLKVQKKMNENEIREIKAKNEIIDNVMLDLEMIFDKADIRRNFEHFEKLENDK